MNNKILAKSIKVKALRIYTPSSPIKDEMFFQGRKRELKCAEENLLMPGKHIIVFGDRGVGKTSFLNMLLKKRKGIIYRCSSEDNIKTIFLEVLKAIDAHKIESKSIRTESVIAKAGVDLKFVNLGVEPGKTTETEYQPASCQKVTPNFLAAGFKDKEIILAIDEFDRIEDARTKRFIAELIKNFSDADVKAKVVIVGIADSVSSLIGTHKSISRNVQQIRIERLSEDEIISIPRSGEKALKVKFDQQVIEMIVDYSDRFPHFAHLLSLGCIDSLVNRIEKDEKPFDKITAKDFAPNALNYAVSMIEETLQDSYTKAIQSQKGSQIFKHTLWACALDVRTEVHINDIREVVCRLQKRNVKKLELVYPLGTLIKEERGSILYKARRCCYKFKNPVMKAYVRMALARDNPLAEINGYRKKADMRLKTIKTEMKLEKANGPSVA